MKRPLRILALLLAMLLIFTACGKKEGNEGGNSGSGSESSSSQAGPFDYSAPFGDNGYWKDVKASDYVTLGDSKSYKVDEAEVDQLVTYYLAAYPKTTPLYEGEVKDGDSVNIDYVGYVDGKAFDGGNTNGQGTEVTIGVTQYIDDFLQQLIGHKVGDSFDINVTFPEDYGVDELNGKDAVFKTTINYIVEYAANELSDDFVMTYFNQDFGWETVSDMRSGIVQNLAMNNAFSTAEFKETPQVMIDYVKKDIENQVNTNYAYFEQLASQYNVDVQTVLYTTVGYETKEDYLNGMLEGHEQQAQFYLFYQALAEDMGVTMSEKDVVAKLAEIDDGSVSKDELISFYGMNFMKWQVMVETVVKKLGEMAQ